jgi:hypothetical protein
VIQHHHDIAALQCLGLDGDPLEQELEWARMKYLNMKAAVNRAKMKDELVT